MEKYDVSGLNDLITRTGRLIDNDPLMNASEEIDDIKANFELVHKVMSDEKLSESEKKGWLGSLISRLTGKDEGFRFKSFEAKIQSIFSSFDITYESIINAIKMYENYRVGIEKELEKLGDFLKEIDETTLVGNDLMEYKNYKIMGQNLALSLSRVATSENSAREVAETMRIGRPIFQTILSSCMIEVSGQHSTQASLQMLDVINGAIEGLSNKLTEATVATSKMALNISSKPVLSEASIQKNMLLVANNLENLKNLKDKLLLDGGTKI